VFATDMAGRVQDLAAFGASGQVRNLHLHPLGDTRGCPSQNPFGGLKTNFPFHWLFSDLTLSWSDLDRECQRLRRGKKKKPRCTEVEFCPGSIGSAV
jgi:hypothetical protein